MRGPGRTLLGGAVLIASIVGARSAEARTRLEVRHAASPPPASSLAVSNNAFGIALFRTLFQARPSGNVFISPVSTATALEMAYDGAGGSTAAGMARTLRLRMDAGTTRVAARKLINSLSSTGSSDGLSLASSLWARSGVPFKQQFIQHARSGYGAKITSLDFKSPRAPATINAWVNAATRGKIPTIVDRIPPDLIMYLINAVYFHGKWATPFNPTATQPHVFTLRGGTTVQVPTMSVEGNFPYFKGSDFEAITLPYRLGRFGMSIVLPASGSDLQPLTQKLTDRTWAAWTGRSRIMFGSLNLPRLTLTNDFQLAGPLQRLGMDAAFSHRADFSGMCLHACQLSQARHKTFLKVDEKGTTAAGATSVGVSPTALQQKRFSMIVDRPFFLAISDVTTGSILFFGAINNPAASS